MMIAERVGIVRYVVSFAVDGFVKVRPK